MKRTSLALLFLLFSGAAAGAPQSRSSSSSSGVPQSSSSSPSGAAQSSSSRPHVEYLASDELAGRLTASAGAAQAADYIIEQLQTIGAQPLPGADGFRLPFEFTSGVTDAGTRLSIRAPGEAHFSAADGGIRALSFSTPGTLAAPVVFAGYGISVPASQDYPYDNFATLDVRDKIVVVFRYMPEDIDQETRAILGRYTGLRSKAMRARELGAKALLVVTGPNSSNAGELIPMTFDAAAAGSGILAASISGDAAAALFAAATDETLADLQAAFDTGNPHAAGFDLDGVEVELDIKLERQRSTGYNVVGYLPPSDPGGAALDKPFVMLGAHYDHLGMGAGGNSLARAGETGEVHNGADDNASGVAAVLGAGAQLAAQQRDRGIALAFWSGEEFGLLGADAFVAAGIIAANDLAAYLNFDMVGRVRNNQLIIQAVGSSDMWPRLIERTNVPLGFDLRTQDDPWVPTDSTAFNRAEVPTLSFFSGTHEQYHSPRDDADLINYEGLDRVARFGALVARRVANAEAPPAFVTVAQVAPEGGSRDAAQLFTGTIPSYSSEAEGLLLGGVIAGGPAAAAGLQEGDLIVEFAGQTIANIYDYMLALESQKIDVPVQVAYMRDGERFEVELTPRARR